MSGAFSPLFEAMLYRDRDAIRGAVTADGSDDPGALFRDLMRFGVLAFAPSEHGRASFLAVRTAPKLELTTAQAAALAYECAVYLADTRPPWSEPPIGDPPPLEAGQRDDQPEIEEAISSGDRLRGEKWLAANLAHEQLPVRFFSAAIAASGESLLTIPVALALWDVALEVPAHVRFSVLRNAVNDWTQHPHEVRVVSQSNRSWAEAMKPICAVAARGAATIFDLQRIVALDAARRLENTAGDALSRGAVAAILSDADDDGGGEERVELKAPPPVYALARDYATYLQLYGMKDLMTELVGREQSIRVLNASWQLMQRENFEDWTLA
jgi:hypothetical protein